MYYTEQEALSVALIYTDDRGTPSVSAILKHNLMALDFLSLRFVRAY
jgi:hypothetical protein